MSTGKRGGAAQGGGAKPAGGALPGDLPKRLVDVATELFAARGFENTSVQDVCNAAGVTKGALYYYFSSKDELLYEIYGRMLRLQMDHLNEYAEADLPVIERVRLIAADVVVTSIAQMHHTVIFWRSLHQLTPEMQATVRKERRRYHERFRDLLLEGQRAGVFRDDISANVVIDFFFGSVHHLGFWFRRDGPLSSEQVGEQFAELLLSSLVPVTK
jgi:AcrR family transcriptional regulator